jgi:hypothetical protein
LNSWILMQNLKTHQYQYEMLKILKLETNELFQGNFVSLLRYLHV